MISLLDWNAIFVKEILCIIGNAKYEGICLQPILCKEKCGFARYGADGEREGGNHMSVP